MIDIFLHPIDDEITGFELGGISIKIGNKEFSSENKKPDQSMMIFLAVSDLLNGIKSLWEGKSDKFQFVGTDSSFSILFKKKKKDILQLIHEKEVAEVEFKKFKDECYYSINRFYLTYCEKIDPNDAGLFDLKNSLNDYKSIIK